MEAGDPQDQLSCKTLFPATGVAWVWLQRTFEEWETGCGHAPGVLEAPVGGTRGHFPLLASDSSPVS